MKKLGALKKLGKLVNFNFWLFRHKRLPTPGLASSVLYGSAEEQGV